MVLHRLKHPSRFVKRERVCEGGDSDPEPVQIVATSARYVMIAGAKLGTASYLGRTLCSSKCGGTFCAVLLDGSEAQIRHQSVKPYHNHVEEKNYQQAELYALVPECTSLCIDPETQEHNAQRGTPQKLLEF